MNKILALLSLFALIFTVNHAQANAYKCAKMVVDQGWLKDYQYIGNTWGANTKKHGALSSSLGSSMEKTTSSFDIGMATGQIMSSAQYTSSWGDCSMLDYHITEQMREDYIEQNMEEIKKQIAMGSGYHMDSLAFLSGCKNISHDQWQKALKANTESLYDAKEAKSFVIELEKTISNNQSLNPNCKMPNSLS